MKMIVQLRTLLTASFLLFSSFQTYAVEVQKVVSDSGIEAWLVEEDSIPLISIEFATIGGARLDPLEKAGRSHLMAGMLNEGAGDMDSQAFQKRLDELSIDMSFDVSRDHFAGSFRTLNRNADEAFRLFALALKEPRFDADAIERVRGQIMAGYAYDEQNPNRVASKKWFSEAFPNMAYGISSDGRPETMAQLNAEDLHSAHRVQLVRNHLKVAVVGAISAQELKKRLDQVFGPLPERGTVESTVSSYMDEAKLEVIERDQPQTVVMFGGRGFLRSDEDFIPAYVMNYILGGGGFSSRLTEEIREKRGLVYSVYSYMYPFDEAGLWVGGLATKNESAVEALKLVEAEASKMAQGGVTSKELEHAKTFLTGSYALRFDSNRKIASNLLNIQLQGFEPDYIDRRNDLINAVTMEDITRVAKRLFDPVSLRIIAVGKPVGVM